MEFVSFELKESNIQTVMNLAEDLSPLEFDPNLMKQVLLNLIKNAAEAMHAGGTLSISTEEGTGEVRITIADSGSGISGENFVKVFEPFFTTKEKGTGLGLTLVFKVIKEHGGEIEVKSKEGKGTVFSISLPIPQIDRRLLSFQALAAEGGHG
jgi:signal transduction histidine kinase